jgi:hypothetical protein
MIAGRCLVIGAGVAGLEVARRLAPLYTEVLVVERAGRVGGRWVTGTDQATGVQYDLGAYRLHATHVRALALCQELGVHLIPWRTSAASSPAALLDGIDTRKGTRAAWDVVALSHGTTVADATDLATGYAGTLNGAQVDAIPETNDDAWLVPATGFGEVATRLYRAATNAGVRVIMQQAVTMLWEGGAQVLDRTTARTSTISFDWCIVTVPPDALAAMHWAPGRALRAALQSHDAIRVFARVSGIPPTIDTRRRKVYLPHHPCQQVMDLPPVRGGTDLSAFPLVQVAYAQGRFARLLRDANDSERHRLLTDGVRRAFAAPNAEIHEVVDQRYWEASVHSWRPAPGGTPLPAVVIKPGGFTSRILVCGEAYSRTRQSWAEGALETVAAAINVIANSSRTDDSLLLPTYSTTHIPPFPYVVVDKRVLDLQSWFTHHPGGAAALQNHLGEDITTLFHVLHTHSDRAQAVTLSLQRGWWVGPTAPQEITRSLP